MKRPRRDDRSAEALAYRRLYKTAEWRALRARQLAEQPLCERHLRKGQLRAATVVNHRKPHQGDRSLFRDPDNLESVCKECHDGLIQSEERLGFSKDIGADGWPTDPQHPSNRGIDC